MALTKGAKVAIAMIIVIGAVLAVGFALNWGKSNNKTSSTTKPKISSGPRSTRGSVTYSLPPPRTTLRQIATRAAPTTTQRAPRSTRAPSFTQTPPRSSPGGFGCCARQETGCCTDEWCNRSESNCGDCEGSWSMVQDQSMINMSPGSTGCCQRDVDTSGCCGSDMWCNETSENCTSKCNGTWIPPL